jgi:hypothetical protein
MSRGFDERDDYDDSLAGDSAEAHRGTLILVLGILGLVVCGFIGIAAWMMGKSDLDKMSRGLMDREGEGMTRAGYVLGIISTILALIGTVFVGLYIAGVVVFLAAR